MLPARSVAKMQNEALSPEEHGEDGEIDSRECVLNCIIVAGFGGKALQECCYEMNDGTNKRLSMQYCCIHGLDDNQEQARRRSSSVAKQSRLIFQRRLAKCLDGSWVILTT